MTPNPKDPIDSTDPMDSQDPKDPTDFRSPERTLIEDYIVQKLEEKGWQFVAARDLERTSYEEPLLIPNLLRALGRINESIGIGDEEMNKVINELKLSGAGIEGAKRILNFFKFGVPVKFEEDRVVRYVRLFNHETPEANEFIVSRQVDYRGRERIRTDIVLYVNGVPLVNIECKNPVSLSESWYNAYSQIKDYEQTVPELYKYVQIGVAAETVCRYFPTVPWSGHTPNHGHVAIYEWREEGRDSIDSTLEMLSPGRLLDIIKNFLFFRVELGEATKVIARYMQYRAANKIVTRVIGSLESEASLGSNEPWGSREWILDSGELEDSEIPRPRKRGLIWHWQGSGKTLTMIFAANKLYYAKELGNPTIFLIVDRVDLENQLRDDFSALDILKPEVVGSVDQLREVLAYDEYRGKRGVFIVLIHKFRPDELGPLQKEMERLSRRVVTVMNRKNVVGFIDEAHRTQYGLLSAQMKALLQNAFLFALTGTPISKRGRDTYLEFSYPPEESYLDRYFITDSIKDGFTVRILYQPRLGAGFHLDRQKLETFLETEFEELPEEVRDDVEARVRKELNAIRVILEDPERIRRVAENIVRHFRSRVDGKFKAMVVAASRKACVAYKRAIDEHLPAEYSEVVMSYRQHDQPVIREYVKEPIARYGDSDVDAIKKRIIERFREEEFPKILIVTDMLLTGFNAPNLQVMYLDKPLKEHRLLQAAARTNRPFKGLKEAGIVIDYVGVLKHFKRALKAYREEDIKGALSSYASLKKQFCELVESTARMFAGIPRDYSRDTLVTAIELITADEEMEEQFAQQYRKLRSAFELLSSDEVRLEHLEIFKWLTGVYTYYSKVVKSEPDIDAYVRKYFEKTLELIYHTTEVRELEKILPATPLDERYLDILEQTSDSEKERAANILFTLNRLVLVEKHRNPIYESLVEKVERLLEEWRQKTKDYERIYLEGVTVVREIQSLSERQRKLRLSQVEYAVLLILEGQFGKDEQHVKTAKDLASRVEEHMFPGWMAQTTAGKEVEREVRRFVRALKKRHNLSLGQMNELHRKLLESVKNYGG